MLLKKIEGKGVKSLKKERKKEKLQKTLHQLIVSMPLILTHTVFLK